MRLILSIRKMKHKKRLQSIFDFRKKIISENNEKFSGKKLLENFYNKSKVKSIVVICAHSDDEIFGLGATLAKYASLGAKIYTVILSYGEKSNPVFKKDIMIKTRQREAEEADDFIGGNGVEFVGLHEGSFMNDYPVHKEKLVDIIKKKHPDIIFTHSPTDLHKDHRNTLAIVKDLITTVYPKKKKGETVKRPLVFAFDIWTFFNFRNRSLPVLYVDVSDFFKEKTEALKLFKSQRMSLFFLGFGVYLNAIFNGFKIGKRFAEAFYKINV